jgi:hypothetical protein
VSALKISLGSSKNKLLVPLINDMPLHSLINPAKEAESLANNYIAQISKNPLVIVLGLGFGYHLDEIYKIMSLAHENFSIFVIEGITEISRMAQSHKTFPSEIKIITNNQVSNIFKHGELLEALAKKPTVIIHPTSFKMNEQFYRDFLTYKYSENFKQDIIEHFNLPSKNLTFLFNQIGHQ